MQPVAAAVGEGELIGDGLPGGVGAVGARWRERSELDIEAVVEGRERVLRDRNEVGMLGIERPGHSELRGRGGEGEGSLGMLLIANLDQRLLEKAVGGAAVDGAGAVVDPL